MSNYNVLRKIVGQANRDAAQQWRQLGTTAATVTVNFWCVKPVSGNAVLSVLTARQGQTTSDALTWIDSATKTFYQDELYTGPFTQIRLTSGEVIIYLSDANG